MISVLDTRGVAVEVAATESRPSRSGGRGALVWRLRGWWKSTWYLETRGGGGRGAEMLPADPSKERPSPSARRIAEQPSGPGGHEEAACLEREAATA